MYHKLDIFTFQWKCCRELSVRTLGRLWFARHRFVNIEKGSANDTFTIVSSVTADSVIGGIKVYDQFICTQICIASRHRHFPFV